MTDRDDGPCVEVLLSTFQGEAYLREQVDSVLGQSYANFRVLARDDGSTDGTPRILERYAAENPGVFKLLRDARGNLGAAGSFAALLEQCRAPYVMLCDQDDVWQPDKVAVALETMRELEQRKPPRTPALVFTDLCVTDEGLNTLHASFWEWRGIRPEQATLNRLLAENIAPGCTMMLNAALRERALPVYEGAVMHDYWLILVAALTGAVGAVERPTVLYRQHGANALGVHGKWTGGRVRERRRTRRDVLTAARGIARAARKPRAVQYGRHFAQAEELLRRFEKEMNEDTARTIAAFVSLRDAAVVQRIGTTLRHGFLRPTLMESLAFVFRP